MRAASVAVNSYLDDASGVRGEADKVFLPSTVSEVQEIVRTCSAERIPLTVSGAGTGLAGGRVPHGGYVISLEKLRTLEIQPGEARCGAGVVLSQLQHEAGNTKQFFGPNPTENSACIGGIVATNAGGARSFRYGSVRHHVLGLQVVLMNGDVVEWKRGDRVDFPVPAIRQPDTTKNSAGYYLRENTEWVDLFTGSEGTLGVITAATLLLIPEPNAILSGVVFFPADELAIQAVEAWRAIPELRLLEYMDENALGFLRAAYPDISPEARAAVLIEQNLQSKEDQEVDIWAERLQQSSALEESWFGFQAIDRARFAELRHALPVLVIDTVRRNGFSKYGTDFAVPFARLRELHAYYRRRCEEVLPGRWTIFGHVGDANNHVNVIPSTREEAQAGHELLDKFARYVVSLRGTVAAEHGIGKNKVDLLRLMYLPEEIESMRSVKRRLDPHWLLGQGTILET